MLAIFCYFSADYSGAQSRLRSGWSISSIQANFGGSGPKGIDGSVDEFKQLFSESRILQDSLRYDLHYTALTPTTNMNRISVLMDIKPPFLNNDTFRRGFRFRAGLTLSNGAILNNTFHYQEVLSSDTAIFMPSGHTAFFDTIQDRIIEMNYYNSSVNARLGFLYNFGRSSGIFSFLLGLESNVGVVTNRYTEVALSSKTGYQWGLTDYPETPLQKSLPTDYLPVASETKNYSKHFLHTTNLIVGFEANGFAPKERWRPLTITLTFTPGIQYNPVPELDRKFVYASSTAIGLAYRFD